MDWDLGIDLSRQNDGTDDDEVVELVMNEHKHPKAEASSVSAKVSLSADPGSMIKSLCSPRPGDMYLIIFIIRGSAARLKEASLALDTVVD